MKTVKISKRELPELEVIEYELMVFVSKASSGLRLIREADEYFTQVMVLDIAQNLYYQFRNKVESHPGKGKLASMTVSASEAVPLMLVAVQDLPRWNEYHRHVMRKLLAELEKQLFDLNLPKETYSSTL